ncbi:MAG TPA: glycosyltransferase [Candidatus Binatia bacterium]|nr:glycosyltransferase [Candidatus Binatia bacterium]
MRVLFFSPHYATMGGTRLIVDALARATRAAGHEAVAIVDGDAGGAPVPATAVPLYPFPARAREWWRVRHFGRRFPAAIVRLVRAVRRAAPDLVSVHCVRRFAPYVAAVRRLTGVPQVLSLQEAHVPPGMPENPGLFRMLVRAADGVGACSAEAAAYARAAGAGLVRLVPNGYDPAELAGGAPFPHPRPYVLGVGRLEMQKGFDVLIDALARLPRADVDLLLAGDGSRRAALEALAGARGVASRVRFLGATDRATTVALFHGAAVVACPSRFEGLPLVCVEALAAGRPVVASCVNGIPELVADGETGLLVPPDDAAALAAALGRLLDAPAAAAALAARGRAKVAREHTWDAVGRAYLALCAEVLALGARAAAS